MTAPPSTAAERRDHARAAGTEAAQILTGAERAIFAAMASAAARVATGSLAAQMATRKVRVSTAAELGAASSRLRAVYGRAAKQATGEAGPLPDAPSQVAAAILHAQHDAGVAFGAVLAAMGAEGSRMPPPSSPYRRIVNRAQRGTGAGLPAARLALAAISERGLTGYVSPKGRRWPLAAYAERAVRTSVARLAKAPFTSEIAARREALLARHTAAIGAAWNGAVRDLDPSIPAAAFRRDSRVTSQAPDATVAKRWRTEAASGAVAGWLAGIYQSGGYGALLAALGNVVRDGMAEGEADAMAAAAYQQHLGAFDTDAAFTAALATLAGDYGVTRQAQEAAAGLIAAASAGVARALAGQPDDAGEDEDAEAVRGAVSGGGFGALGRAVDYALWGAFGTGAIGLWKRAASALGGMFSPTVLVTWEDTASACLLCQQNAAGSPYAPEDVPPFPAHGSCRCDLSSEAQLPLSFLAPFLS